MLYYLCVLLCYVHKIVSTDNAIPSKKEKSSKWNRESLDIYQKDDNDDTCL